LDKAGIATADTLHYDENFDDRAGSMNSLDIHDQGSGIEQR
jgi:hypothetical protein